MTPFVLLTAEVMGVEVALVCGRGDADESEGVLNKTDWSCC